MACQWAEDVSIANKDRVGGFINSFTTWRWTFYVLLIWTGAILVSLVLFVPETYHPVYVALVRSCCHLLIVTRLLRRKAQKLRKETGDERWKAPIEKLQRSVAQTVLRSIYRPLLLLTLEPMCLNLCIFSAILLGILYLFFGAFQLVFENVYGMDLWQRGLVFIGLSVGMLFAILSDPFWRRIYAKLEHKHEAATGKADDPQPEWRLPPGMLLFSILVTDQLTGMCSDSRRTAGDYRAVYFRMDHLSACTLDRTDHWQCILRGRVSVPSTSIVKLLLTRPPGRSWSTRVSSPFWSTRIQCTLQVLWQQTAVHVRRLGESFPCLAFKVSEP